MVRMKNRYIVCHIDLPDKPKYYQLEVSANLIWTAIINKIESLHGEYGVAAAPFAAKYINPRTRIVIIRAKHGPHKLVTSALPFITKIGQIEANMHILYCGACIIQCFRFIADYHQKRFDELAGTLESAEDIKLLKQAIADFDDTGFGKKDPPKKEKQDKKENMIVDEDEDDSD